ncbi:methyltransferase domain-containing protein [Georgenia wutianyii]|uniref:Methyltransferase domain-containing protein n=1 Tax=Georgenia wutianyii TaxID=2585135 RepID=A0ABX5VPY3_9MICO|nr:class I SAM-dependent methyltransferase [Georgenia wutianyii]QDB78595.1 methyltransferase domain-containing protein [Georgenia wutianyii]
MSADDYDDFAVEYDAENANSLLNAHYERPAVLRLLGDVDGRRILDAGCGSGPLAAELVGRGADVTGFDGSPAMIELARRRLGQTVPLTIHDLSQPLPYEDETFDDVVASLVLHYLQDWDPPLAEIRRVLKPGGRLVASVNHPFARQINAMHEDYFATREYGEEVDLNGRTTTLTFWHRPLCEVVRAVLDADLRLRVLDEPPPSAETPPELMPPRIASGERSAFLCFLFLVAEKPEAREPLPAA